MSLPTNKDELVTGLHEQIDNASRKIDELRLQVNLGKAEIQSALEERITLLESQKRKLYEEINHLKNTTDSAWNELAEGCQKSWNELQNAIQKAFEEFKS